MTSPQPPPRKGREDYYLSTWIFDKKTGKFNYKPTNLMICKYRGIPTIILKGNVKAKAIET